MRTRRVAANSFLRLGSDLAMKVREDQPDLLLVQYTAPLGCTVGVVVAVHDVGFLEHPEYFARGRAWQLSVTVGTVCAVAASAIASRMMVSCVPHFAPMLGEFAVLTPEM
jgi:hypothetical protein